MANLHLGMKALVHVVEVAGIIAFASSGFIEARRRRMDWVGVFTVAFITAFGGGTLRDLLLDRRPLFWVEHQEYPVIIFFAALLATPFWRKLQHSSTEKIIDVADALGLGLFSVTGASIALNAGMPWFIAAMMGVITGIFGGVLRDMICNEIPMVFKRGQLYASCSFIGCWVFILLDYFDADPLLCLIAGSLACFSLRMAALRWNLKLPG